MRGEPLRYLTLSAEREMSHMPRATYEPKRFVWNVDAAKSGGDLLIICEGPFDGLKLQWALRDFEYAVVALLGMPKPEQVLRLSQIAKRFAVVVVMLDREAHSQAVELAETLETLSLKQVDVVEPTAKDPGEMTSTEIVNEFSGL